MKYAVEMNHILRTDNITADALSRYTNTNVENTILQIEVEGKSHFYQYNQQI